MMSRNFGVRPAHRFAWSHLDNPAGTSWSWLAYDSNGNPLNFFEDTGLNRSLGSPNNSPDYLYGGTGLDFLYGNGPYNPPIYQLFTKEGKLFQDMQNASASGGDNAVALFAENRQQSQIVNLLQIDGEDQVTLKLTVAEVKRSVLKQLGFKAVQHPVSVHDLHATILHLLGFDHERLTYRYAGRDFRLTDVHGKVVKAVVA